MSNQEQFTQYLNDKVNKQVENGNSSLREHCQKVIDSYNKNASEPFSEEQTEFVKSLSSAIAKNSVAMSAAVTAEMFNDDTEKR